ncbi:MAG TPA: hypothetical protein VMR73_00460, partial [Candidatus Paceibacterota bacterium]|nr:hypothetical protein [Candidatus Paceibacterota bacterium]
MNRNTFVNTFGWYGAIVTLLAYALISAGFFGANNVWYQALNFTGAIGLTSIAAYKKDYPLVVLNAVWAVIAFIFLIKILW